MKWKMVKIGDLCSSILSGGTPTTKNASFWDGDIPWISSADISDHKNITIKRYVSNHTKVNILPASNILVVTRVGLGKVIINDSDIAFSQDIQGLILKPSVNNRYLLYCLLEKTKRFKEVSRGATIKGVTRSDLVNIEIPLPPLRIQEQIANTLDKADALRRKDQELLIKYDELAQAIFYDMFGDPVKNEKGWEIVKLFKLISSLSAGVSVNSVDDVPGKEKKCVLKTSCVYSGKFNPLQAKVIVDSEIGRARINPQKDSIIISRMNTAELVGKSAYVDKNYENLFLPDRLWMTSKGDLKHSVIWLSFALKTQMFMDQVTRIATGTSGSMKNIGKKEFLDLQIIYPKIEKQLLFERILRKIEPSIDHLETVNNSSQKLFDRMMSVYFS